MSYPFEEIIIIFNPNSTGPSKQNATDLQKTLKAALPAAVKIETKGTKDVGHAEHIGASYAKNDSKTLLVSSSGDGGYNELVNGVLQLPTHNVTVAVMPSGNANDHHHATAEAELEKRIIMGKTRMIDVLRVEALQEGKPWSRFAHSYVGIGLTAYIGEKLTKADLNPINEKWLVLKYMLRFSHVSLQLEGTQRMRAYSNVIFGNIDRMSKVIRLSNDSNIDDGEFEVYAVPSASIWKLLKILIIGATSGFEAMTKTSSYEVETKRSYKIQLDGEVSKIDAGKIKILMEKRGLRSLK